MSTNKDTLPVTYSQPGLTINWGSILSGLVFILALGWLLFTLGSAIGLSIADVQDIHDRDLSSKTAALGTAATVWILVTVIATYFLGGFLSGKVSGRTDKATGLLHGVVLWSCTIIIGIIFSAIGVTGIMNAAAGAAKSVASTGGQAVSMMAGGMTGGYMASGHKDMGSSQLGSLLHPLTGSLKQDLNKALEKARQTKKDSQSNSGNDSNSTGSKNDNPSAADQRQSNSSQNSSSAISSSEANSDQNDSSNDANAENTSRSTNGNEHEHEETAMTEAAEDDREGREGQPAHSAEKPKDEKKYTDEKSDNAKGYAHEYGKRHYREKSAYHSESRSVERAIEKIDPQVLIAVAMALVQGDEKRAKGIITNHYDIDEAEIDKLIKAAKQQAEQTAKELEKKMDEAKDYAAGLLWVIFLSYLIGLIACISGAQLAMRSPNLLDTAGAKSSSDKKY